MHCKIFFVKVHSLFMSKFFSQNFNLKMMLEQHIIHVDQFNSNPILNTHKKLKNIFTRNEYSLTDENLGSDSIWNSRYLFHTEWFFCFNISSCDKNEYEICVKNNWHKFERTFTEYFLLCRRHNFLLTEFSRWDNT